MLYGESYVWWSCLRTTPLNRPYIDWSRQEKEGKVGEKERKSRRKRWEAVVSRTNTGMVPFLFFLIIIYLFLYYASDTLAPIRNRTVIQLKIAYQLVTIASHEIRTLTFPKGTQTPRVTESNGRLHRDWNLGISIRKIDSTNHRIPIQTILTNLLIFHKTTIAFTRTVL